MNQTITLPVRFELRSNRRRYAINESGDPKETRTRSQRVFDVAELRNKLLSIREENERTDLTEFLNAAGYLPRRGRKWREADLTDAAVDRWRVYRKITMTMATHTGFEWGSKVLNPEIFPEEVIERATRVFMIGVRGTLQLKIGPTFEDGGYRPEYVSEIETHDPLDAIWVHLQLDRLRGIGYQQCRSRSCGKFFELPFFGDTRKRRKEFCNPTCASREQKAEERDDLNKRCLAILKSARAEYRRMPRAQRSDNPSRDILDLIVRDWPTFPRKQNWITKELNEERQQ